MGVIAGAVSFSYDDIMHLRVAVSEVFDRAIKNVRREEWASEVHDLTVRFGIQPDKIEVLIAYPTGYTGHLASEEAKESQAVVKSLMDEVEFDIEADGKSAVRMVKYQSAAKTQ
jgi:anti-sigma regulatory factor (Ser/Thr protein kinase)